MSSITSEKFGTTASGEAVTLYRMENKAGNYVEVLDYGCTIRSIVLKDKSGNMADVCLGYDTMEAYETNDGYLGAAIGRHANRIGCGHFTLNGADYQLACNDGENHLHGGVKGFDRWIWKTEVIGDELRFFRRSPDGEEGYPGNLDIRIAYSWDDKNKLRISYRARSDQDTVLNLTNHTYFNLAGGGTVLDHTLRVDADQFTQNDAHCLPTGRFLKAAGAMDFRTEKKLGQDIESEDCNLKDSRGYDHNYVLNKPSVDHVSASLFCESTGIRMDVQTDQPGLQVYSGNFLTKRKGKSGKTYHIHDAVCLETQHFPNSLACHFDPPAILYAGKIFESQTEYIFTINPGCL